MPTWSSPPPPDTAPLMDWAQWYAAQDWPVFPCRGKNPWIAKAAGGNGHLDATTDPFQIAIWWRQWPTANIGCPSGPHWWGMDVDGHHGGDNTLFALERRHGSLPHTLMSHTGSGTSSHYFWSRPPDAIQNKTDLGDGIDVQAEGKSYLILPPSIHPDTGKPYLWDLVDGPEDIMPQPAPAWLEALVTQSTNGTTPAKAVAAPGAPIPQGRRANTLASMAGVMRHAGATVEEITAALLVLNARCVPPLSQEEVEKTARSIGRYAPSGQLAVLPQVSTPMASIPAFMPASAIPGAARQPFDFTAGISATELLRLMLVPPRFLVEKLVPDGVTILAAPAKSYKSYFALSLALATVGEGDWCDTFPVDQCGNVVFFGLESPPMQLRNRLHQLRPSYQPANSPYTLTFFSGMHALPTFKNGLEQALEDVIGHYSPRLIVIDPLSYLYRLGRQDDLMSATLDLLWPIAEMASKAQVAILAPEHLRKRSKDDVSVVDQLAGSHIKAAIVHSLLMLRRQADDIVIETVLRDAASQELVLTLGFDATLHRVIWGYKGSALVSGATRQESMKSQVLADIKSKGYPMKVADIVTSLTLPSTEQTKTSIRVILHRAEQDGDVAVSKRGEYYWIGPK
mgnify:CR=1 FL=1